MVMKQAVVTLCIFYCVAPFNALFFIEQFLNYQLEISNQKCLELKPVAN